MNFAKIVLISFCVVSIFGCSGQFVPKINNNNQIISKNQLKQQLIQAVGMSEENIFIEGCNYLIPSTSDVQSAWSRVWLDEYKKDVNDCDNRTIQTISILRRAKWPIGMAIIINKKERHAVPIVLTQEGFLFLDFFFGQKKIIKINKKPVYVLFPRWIITTNMVAINTSMNIKKKYSVKKIFLLEQLRIFFRKDPIKLLKLVKLLDERYEVPYINNIRLEFNKVGRDPWDMINYSRNSGISMLWAIISNRDSDNKEEVIIVIAREGVYILGRKGELPIQATKIYGAIAP